MGRKNKEVIPLAFAEIETALKTRIQEIEKLSDTAAQLLEYKALQKSTAGTYDPGKVRVSREICIDEAMGKGALTGFGLGFPPSGAGPA